MTSRSTSSTPTKVAENMFPGILWKMVNDPQNIEIIRWGRNEDTIIILNEKRFEKEICPKYFQHQKYSSFTKQLNTYGFSKLGRSVEEPYEFKNEFFKKSDPKCF